MSSATTEFGILIRQVKRVVISLYMHLRFVGWLWFCVRMSRLLIVRSIVAEIVREMAL